jgi:hypothetical protein
MFDFVGFAGHVLRIVRRIIHACVPPKVWKIQDQKKAATARASLNICPSVARL